MLMQDLKEGRALLGCQQWKESPEQSGAGALNNKGFHAIKCPSALRHHLDLGSKVGGKELSYFWDIWGSPRLGFRFTI